MEVDRGRPGEDICDMLHAALAWSDDILFLMSGVNTAHVKGSRPPQRAVNLPAHTAAPLIQEVLSNKCNEGD